LVTTGGLCFAAALQGRRRQILQKEEIVKNAVNPAIKPKISSAFLHKNKNRV
jgi:hypothetical protein